RRYRAAARRHRQAAAAARGDSSACRRTLALMLRSRASSAFTHVFGASQARLRASSTRYGAASRSMRGTAPPHPSRRALRALLRMRRLAWGLARVHGADEGERVRPIRSSRCPSSAHSRESGNPEPPVTIPDLGPCFRGDERTLLRQFDDLVHAFYAVIDRDLKDRMLFLDPQPGFFRGFV